MSQYPSVFPHTIVDPKLFYKFYAQVCTRCFGWGLPSTAMIPMADNFNHSDVTVVQEIVHKPSHITADTSSKYFTKTKYMNDYSICFDAAEYAGHEMKTKNVTGRYSRKNYQANQQFQDVEKIKAALDSGI